MTPPSSGRGPHRRPERGRRVQGDNFAKAIRGEGPLEFPVDDAVKNMAVIDAVFRSAESGQWETVTA
jgi:predicted dehydrogenase